LCHFWCTGFRTASPLFILSGEPLHSQPRLGHLFVVKTFKPFLFFDPFSLLSPFFSFYYFKGIRSSKFPFRFSPRVMRVSLREWIINFSISFFRCFFPRITYYSTRGGVPTIFPARLPPPLSMVMQLSSTGGARRFCSGFPTTKFPEPPFTQVSSQPPFFFMSRDLDNTFTVSFLFSFLFSPCQTKPCHDPSFPVDLR